MKRFLSEDKQERDWQVMLYAWMFLTGSVILSAILKPEWWR